MKNLFVFVLLSTLCISARAFVVDFDSLNPGTGFATQVGPQNQHQGFTWANFGILNTFGNSTGKDTGYRHLDSVGIAWTFPNAIAEFSADDAFTFNQARFASSRRDGLSVLVSGFDQNGLLTNSETIEINTTEASVFTFDFIDVVRVTFNAAGGLFNQDLDSKFSDTNQFGLDNLVFNEEVSTVPLPASLWFLIIGLGIVTFIKKRIAR